MISMIYRPGRPPRISRARSRWRADADHARLRAFSRAHLVPRPIFPRIARNGAQQSGRLLRIEAALETTVEATTRNRRWRPRSTPGVIRLRVRRQGTAKKSCLPPRSAMIAHGSLLQHRHQGTTPNRQRRPDPIRRLIPRRGKSTLFTRRSRAVAMVRPEVLTHPL